MTDTVLRNKTFVENHKNKYRSLQRTTDFVSFGNNAICLNGWSTKTVADLITSGSKKPFEIVVIDSPNKVKREIGDVVSRNNVFVSSEGAIFDGDKISFSTGEGLYVNIDQYLYLQDKGGLNGNQFFGQAEKKDSDVLTAWKYQLRRSSEARKDKGINISFMTIGALEWSMEDSNNRGKRIRVISPLFLCPVREDSNSKNYPKFSVIQSRLSLNATLARLVKTQYFTEIYDGIPTEFAFSELSSYMKKVAENIADSSELHLCENDLHICLLDSSNEMMCQAVERRINKIAESPIVSILSGAEEYQPKYHGQKTAALYPWAADDTQRDLVQRVISGDSVNGHAGPGTGKSQTCCNVIVNEVINGNRVCVASEKAAALEVIIDYMAKNRLDDYCLVVNDRTTVKSVISKIKRSIAASSVYVETDDAKAVIANYYEAYDDIEKLNCIYDNIPELGTSLYALIGEAITKEDFGCEQYFDISPKDYQKLRRKLGELQSQLIDTVSETEWQKYLQNGTTDDEEQNEMFDEAIVEIESLGLNIRKLVVEKAINKSTVADTSISQMARILAERYIEDFSLKAYGNKKLKAVYKKLIDSSNAMQVISAAFVRQELGRRVKEVAKSSKFVELLDRLATARISLQDFFNKYGTEILELCPILVGTPNALVQYDTLNQFDVLIIDESSQMPFTNVLPFLMGDIQLVVFGDPMQLDITSFWAKSGIYEQQEGDVFDISETDKSILHVVQGKLPGCQLQYHYRSKTEHLITVSNLRCYDGLLNIAPDYYFGRENLPKELGCELIEISDPEISNKGANLSEAREIVERVIEVRSKYPDKSVGIITFNENQQAAINDEIDRKIDEMPELSDALYLQGDALFLRTLENAQGKEADVIFISIGHYRRNQDGSISKQISILNSEGAANRLNVLFTRAKEKVVVTISFSYKELKGADKGVYRLYEYLRYIATGECDGITDIHAKDNDKYNESLVNKVAAILPEHKAYGKVGNANMTVDVGLVKEGETHFDVGLLFSGKTLSPNAICTKVSVLERAGWKILPLSPITCFTKPDVFSKQIENDIGEGIRFNTPCPKTYLTDIEPSVLLKVSDFKQEEPILETAISMEELISTNYFYAYENVFKEEVRLADERKTIKLFKKGDSQATLKLFIYKLRDFVNADRLEDLLDKAKALYEKEKMASYFYAQLLRARANIHDANTINRLLAEAKRIGVKVI